MAHDTLASRIASTLDAQKRCVAAGNTEWAEKHNETMVAIMATAPSGSGIDCGTTLDREASTAERLVFTFSFHHMDESGGYAGWTEHTAVVKASLIFGLDVRITGRDRNGIKDYLHQVYEPWLSGPVE